MLFPRLMGVPLQPLKLQCQQISLQLYGGFKQAWDAVSADTIVNCFKHWGATSY